MSVRVRVGLTVRGCEGQERERGGERRRALIFSSRLGRQKFALSCRISAITEDIGQKIKWPYVRYAAFDSPRYVITV